MSTTLEGCSGLGYSVADRTQHKCSAEYINLVFSIIIEEQEGGYLTEVGRCRSEIRLGGSERLYGSVELRAN